MAVNAGTPVVGSARRRHRRGVMAEINVTPMVDVMLVLLIIFMVSAPLLTVGVPLDLPQTQAKSLETSDQKPIQMSVDINGKVFINDAEIAINELVPKLKAITDARGGLEERIYLRADKKADYGTVARVMGLLSGAGFKKLALVTEADQG
jgi:biopolymer transport protein TolR